MENRSISKIEGWVWRDEIPSEDEGTKYQFYLLHDKPVNSLVPEDIAFLIRQNSGLPTLVPMAMELLRIDPLLEAENYPGDLLCSLLTINDTKGFWKKNVDLKKDVVEIGDLVLKSEKFNHLYKHIKEKITEDYNLFLKGISN